MKKITEQKSSEQKSSGLASLIAIMTICISSALVDAFFRVSKEKKDKKQGGEE